MPTHVSVVAPLGHKHFGSAFVTFEEHDRIVRLQKRRATPITAATTDGPVVLVWDGDAYVVQPDDAVRKAALALLSRLDHMTTEQFSLGGERAEREALRTALGYGEEQ